MPSGLVACRLTTAGAGAAVRESKPAAASMMTGTPCRSRKAAQAAASGASPKGATGMTAARPPGADGSAASTMAGVSCQLAGSTSRNQGTRPAWRTAAAVATKVQLGSAQRLPGVGVWVGAGAPLCNASVRPRVQLATLTRRSGARPYCAARRDSKRCTSGPKFVYQPFRSISSR